MTKIKLHFVPQLVQELATNAQKAENFHRDTYVMRLEAIRDYCDNIIKKLMNSMEDSSVDAPGDNN